MITRNFERIIVNNYSPCVIADIIKSDPLIEQAADVGLEFRGVVELKFSTN